MTQTTSWRAFVRYASSPAPLTDDQVDALMAALPGFAAAVHDGQTIELGMTVQASTLRKATDEALRAGQSAMAAAFDVTGTPVAVRVVTQEAHNAEMAHPPGLDLVGIAEIAQIGGFSRQRAQQVVALPDFPEPVGELAMGKVFTRASVEEFFGRWPRKSGWAGRQTAAAA